MKEKSIDRLSKERIAAILGCLSTLLVCKLFLLPNNIVTEDSFKIIFFPFIFMVLSSLYFYFRPPKAKKPSFAKYPLYIALPAIFVLSFVGSAALLKIIDVFA